MLPLSRVQLVEVNPFWVLLCRAFFDEIEPSKDVISFCGTPGHSPWLYAVVRQGCSCKNNINHLGGNMEGFEFVKSAEDVLSLASNREQGPHNAELPMVFPRKRSFRCLAWQMAEAGREEDVDIARVLLFVCCRANLSGCFFCSGKRNRWVKSGLTAAHRNSAKLMHLNPDAHPKPTGQCANRAMYFGFNDLHLTMLHQTQRHV